MIQPGPLLQTQSFHFQFHPLYLQSPRVNSDSVLRIAINKGVQTCSKVEMPYRCKCSKGKVEFDKVVLPFYLPIYNPLRNIEFAIKIFLCKEEQDEQLLTYSLLSGDYISQYKNEKKVLFAEEVVLAAGNVLGFELFVDRSSPNLQENVKAHWQKRSINKDVSKDSGKLSTSRKGLKSPAGSDQEESLERNDSKKLERKRKHHGQLLMKSNKNQFEEIESPVTERTKSVIDTQHPTINEIGSIQLQSRKQEISRMDWIPSSEKNESQMASQIRGQKKFLKEQKDLISPKKVFTSKRIQSPVKDGKSKAIFLPSEDVNPKIIEYRPYSSAESSSPLIRVPPLLKRNTLTNTIVPDVRTSVHAIARLQSQVHVVSQYSDQPEPKAKEEYQKCKQILFYTLFWTISLILLYNAMFPSKKV